MNKETTQAAINIACIHKSHDLHYKSPRISHVVMGQHSEHLPVWWSLPICKFRDGSSGKAGGHGTGKQHDDDVFWNCLSPPELKGCAHHGIGSGPLRSTTRYMTSCSWLTWNKNWTNGFGRKPSTRPPFQSLLLDSSKLSSERYSGRS